MYKYDFYLRDYRSKTGHLDLLHHGAYKALLDAYYDSEKPLPGGNPTGYFGLCHRLAGAFTQEEQNAVDDVLKAFFTVGEDGCFHNKMADEQIEKYRQFVVSQRKNGVLGGRPRKPNGLRLANPMGNPTGNPNHNPNETLSPTPTPTPTTTTTTTTTLPKHSEVMTEEFLEFYKEYPKHEDKKDAWKAWRDLGNKRPPLETILSAIAKQKTGRKWIDGFIKLPAGWLRNECWDDEIDTRPSRTQDMLPPMRN